MRTGSLVRVGVAAAMAAILVASIGRGSPAGRNPGSLAGLASVTPAAASTATTAPANPGAIRVDQLGYVPGESKFAYLIVARAVEGAPFRVVDAAGDIRLQGTIGPSRGSWNSTYRAVHSIDISKLRAPGTYRIVVGGTIDVTSPPFRVGSTEELFGPRIRDAVAFFQAQRDGPKVIAGPLLIKGATGDWEVVIGLEVHAQVTSNSKLFSGASTEFGGEPEQPRLRWSMRRCRACPVINAFASPQAVRTGLGLKAQINLRSVFDRKNYFYPDLPQGYQISQYKSPIVGEGEVIVDLADGDSIAVGIERLHLEQDAAKSLHDQNPAMSLVDLNRSGVALMEIVSKPDMRSSEQARAYVTKLRAILRYLGTCDGDMEKGSLRADVNVSVRKPGDPLGTRCEIKNVNSIRFIGQAIDYEARRQIGILEDGGLIEQETRLFDPNKGETRSMRSKEEAHDYRYFPDPDLLPLQLTQAYVDELRADLPELPDQKKSRFIDDFGLTPYDASVLVGEHESADFYEAVLAKLATRTRDGKLAANWVINELFGRLNKEGQDISASPVSAAQLAAIVDLIGEGTISGKIAKDLFEIVWQEGGDPRALVEARGMKQVTDIGAIEKAVDEIIAANPDKVAQARAKPQLVGWFVGQVMKSSGGKANPQSVNDLLKTKLGI